MPVGYHGLGKGHGRAAGSVLRLAAVLGALSGRSC